MTPLRSHMIKAMQMRGFSPRTHRSYLAAVTDLARYTRYTQRSPADLKVSDLEAYSAPPSIWSSSGSSREPVAECFSMAFRPIVGSQNIRQTALPFELLEHPHQALARKRCINFDGQRLTIEIIQDVEGAKAHAVVECVAHKIRRPHPIRCVRQTAAKDRGTGTRFLVRRPELPRQLRGHARSSRPMVGTRPIEITIDNK